jgi:preprotein translocase subunit SecD
MKTILVRLAILAALGFSTSALGQSAHVFEIARVAPGGGVKTRTLSITNLGKTSAVIVEAAPQITEAVVTKASVTSQKQKVTSGTKAETRSVPVISVRFTPGGRTLLTALTKEWKGRQLAVIMDGKVVATPRVSAAFGGGELNVTGAFTKEEAEALVAKINAAPRPEGVGELMRPSLFGSNRAGQPKPETASTPARR